jgi:hypothetical protein
MFDFSERKLNLDRLFSVNYHSKKAPFSCLSSGDGTMGPSVLPLEKEVSVGSALLVPSVGVQKIARFPHFTSPMTSLLRQTVPSNCPNPDQE